MASGYKSSFKITQYLICEAFTNYLIKNSFLYASKCLHTVYYFIHLKVLKLTVKGDLHTFLAKAVCCWVSFKIKMLFSMFSTGSLSKEPECPILL